MAYTHGSINNGYSNSNGKSENITWLDYIVVSNPQGVMKVLAQNGYTGFLAPQDNTELKEAAFDFIERDGERGVVELLKSHPLYDVIIGSARNEGRGLTFKNATDTNNVPAVAKTINLKTIENVLAIVGAFVIINYLFTKFQSHE